VDTNIEIISVFILRKYKEEEFLIQHVSNVVATFLLQNPFSFNSEKQSV